MPKRILLCDDEIHILRAAEFKFRRAGYEVRVASDGEEAWERIQEEPPDVLITDCQMPRLDGLGLAQRVRENPATRELPVLLLTAKGFELNAEDLAGRLTVMGVIAKPFSPRELLQKVEQILGTSAPPSATSTSVAACSLARTAAPALNPEP